MKILEKIKQYDLRFTTTEKKIAKYVLENKENVITNSVEVLAENIGVSAPSIIRFARKLGIKGYTLFKVEIAKEINIEKEKDYNDIIKKEDNIKAIGKKYIENTTDTLNKLYNILDINVIEETIQMIEAGKKIYIYGIGASGILAYDLQHKLLKIKKDARYMQDPHIHLSMISHVEEGDVIIAISYLGETKEVNIAVEEGIKRGAKVISITKNSRNTLSKKAHINIYVPNEENEIKLGAISSRISTLAITDMIYLGLVKDNYESVNEYVRESHRIVSRLKS